MATVGKWGQKEPGGASQGTGWASDQPVYEWRGGYTRETAPDNDALKEELFGADKRVGTGMNFRKYSFMKISVQNGPANTAPLTSFEDADLYPTILDNIKALGYTEPTPIQKSAIPILLKNCDLMACAQTGSGKTAAFLLPILSSLLKKMERKRMELSRPGRGSSRACPLALLILPTRELAIQIFDDVRRFTYKTPLRPVAVYGGADVASQRKNLLMGCDVLVGTPGRLKDMINRGTISLARVRHLVLDEADRMLDMGFERDIREIVQQADLPQDEGLQTMMFSATFPRPIQVLARTFLQQGFAQLRIGRIGGTTSDIVQNVMHVEDYAKKDRLVEILLQSPPNRTIIFVETKRSADLLDDYLYNMHFPTVSIHGDREQKEREMSLRAFKDGRSPILIATAVASRGLDIKDVMHVINYDLCNDIDEYVHRIGRTARVGNVGKATSFYNDKNLPIAPRLAKILQECRQEVPEFLAPYMDESTSYEDDDFVGEDDVAEELATATAGLSVDGSEGSWAPETTTTWGAKSSGNSGWETNEPKGDTSSGW
ncbi:MAG: P-loop containing nucleoside triphosphate hydrolase protein [Podila humilis]|nr:MAG: P-loop containing nucleoside triphosphate hydrolase protein [Podila humilis]